MAATSTEIANLALARMGQDLIDDIDGDNVLEEKCKLLYGQTREECLIMGPQLGWKFARRRNRISVDSHTISTFADYSGTVAGTVQCTTATVHNLVSGDIVTISDTTSYNGDFEITLIDTTNFYFTDTWVANDATGTAHWTSEQYLWRFPIPTALEIKSAQVGGVELTDWVREGAYILTNMEEDEIDVAYVQNLTDTTLFPAHFTRVLYISLAIKLVFNILQDARLAEQLINEFEQIVLPRAMAQDEQEQYVREKSTSWIDIGRTTTTLE